MENLISSEANATQPSAFDMAKILEISNFIDDWEKNVLFSPGGFYSLKGKSVFAKTKELLEVLKNDTDKILSETEFESPSSSRKAEEIIKIKISSIREKMLAFEDSEKKNWELQTVESAIEHSKTKAKEYKNYPDMLEVCYMNGLSSVGLKAALTELSKEQTNKLITLYNSEFFEEVVWSFIDDNSLSAIDFYQNNKKYILEEKQNQIEPSLKHLENKLLAFEQAKEFLNCGFSLSQQEEKISSLKGSAELKKYTKLYFEGFINSKNNLLKEKRDELNIKTWENIDNLLETNSDLALFEVDLNQEEKAINAQIKYIQTMIKNRKTETENKKFFELYKMFFENPEKFGAENLFNYKYCLDGSDFEYFNGLKNNTNQEKYLDLKNEYLTLKKYFGKDDDFNVLLIKTLNREKTLWERNNNKQISYLQATQLIESIVAQIKMRNS